MTGEPESAAGPDGAGSSERGGPWYWCLDHGTVEPYASSCPLDRRLGPYPTREAAEHWKDSVDARNKTWDAEDRAWEGEEP